MTREEAIEIIQHIYDVCLSDELREAFPIVIEALEAQDRPKGEWIDEDGTYYANCSKCGYQMDTHVERGYFRYCPNCGADMRGDTE